MLNVIKMDLYKMFKMKSFYVVTIIAMAFGIIMAMNLMPETSDTNTTSLPRFSESLFATGAKDSPSFGPFFTFPRWEQKIGRASCRERV